MTLRGQHLVDAVVETVADFYGLPVADVLGPRHRSATRARKVAMALVRANSDWSYPLIGRAFDRDHTTVIVSCQQVAADARLTEEAAEIWEEIQRGTRADPQVVQIDRGRAG